MRVSFSMLRLVDRAHNRRLLRLGGAILGAATLLGVAAAVVMYLGRIGAGRPVPFAEALIRGMSDWYLWPALVPAVVWLSRRFPIDRNRWPASLLVHVAAGTVLALVEIAGALWFCQTAGLPPRYPTFWQAYLSAVSGWFQFSFLVYWAVVAGVHAVDHYRGLRRQEIESVELRSQLVQAQLRALRMQLHPHFLFNTLNTIAVYAREHRAEEAVGLVAKLGGLLRRSLQRQDNLEVPLRDELGFVETYLDIEQSRIGDRLRVQLQVSPDTLDARVPAMVLQPLVENAIRHGIAHRADGGVVQISATQENGTLRLRVRDNGPGFASLDPLSSEDHVGLQNTRARLVHLYGDAHRLEFADHEEGGAMVTLTIPWHTEPCRWDTS